MMHATNMLQRKPVVEEECKNTFSSSTGLQSTYVTLSCVSAKPFRCAFAAAMAGDTRDGCLNLSVNDASANLRRCPGSE